MKKIAFLIKMIHIIVAYLGTLINYTHKVDAPNE